MSRQFRVQIQQTVWSEVRIEANSLDEALAEGTKIIEDGGGVLDAILPRPTGTYWVLDVDKREVLSNA